MQLETQSAILVLRPGGLVKFRSGRGLRVRCLTGHLWITQHGVPADSFLTQGRGMVVRSPALTIVEALCETTLRVDDAPASGLERLSKWCRRAFIPYF